MRLNRFALILIPCLALTACERNMSSSTVSSSNTVGKVIYGRVVDVQAVTIKDKDSLGQNATGGLAGAAGGAALGSTMGRGNGQTATTVGGAIAGAVLGAIIEDQLSTQQGLQYIVKLDHTGTHTHKSRKNVSVRSDKAIDADAKDSIDMAPTETDTIAVTQSADNPIPVGQRVMVIYNDDRPRVVAVQ